jgi:predicted negative regulator of RcsB-dependent stress response
MVKAREWYRKALETGVDDEEAAKIKMKLDSFD